MSTEILNKTSKNQHLKGYRCNVAQLKERLILQKKKEIFQKRIILTTFCVSLGVIGYFVI